MNPSEKIAINRKYLSAEAKIISREDVPQYMEEVYHWAYLNPRNVALLDRNLVFNGLLFGNGQRLIRAYLREIQAGMRVWQVAHVYGDVINQVAEKLGATGQLDLTDVTAAQIARAHGKIGHLPQASIFHSDAAHWQGRDYDVACSFFLLHEIPEDKKHAVVNRMIQAIQPAGKLIFIDYHRPKFWQPVGWILRLINIKTEPFSNALWHKEISEYADDADAFNWHKRTIFGGVYQIVTATRKQA